MAEDANVAIGRLRWPVLLATRQQVVDLTGTGIIEAFGTMQRVHADVQPVGAITMRLGAQEDWGFTHRIFVRWIAGLNVNDLVFRLTQERNGTARTERFRVLRWKEIAGRKRFGLAEVSLEGYVNADGSYDEFA